MSDMKPLRLHRSSSSLPIGAALAAMVVLVAGCSSSKPDATPGSTSESTSGLNFTATTLDGKDLDTAAFIGKRPVVFWIWAPWCPECNKEAPDVQAAFAKYANNVQFIGVAGRDNQDEMHKFTERHGLTSMTHVVSEDGSLWSRLGVPGQPSWVFVNKDSAVQRNIGAMQKDALFKKLDSMSA